MSEAAPERSGKRILQNGGWMLAPKTVGAVLSLFYLALIARSLGPEAFGAFALIFSFAQSISGIAAFQTWQIIIRYGTQPVLEGKLHILARLVLLCLSLDLAAVILGSVLAFGGIRLFGARLGWAAADQGLVMFFTVILLFSPRSTANGLLRIFDDFKSAALADSLVPVIRLLGVGIVSVTEPKVASYMTIWVLSEIIPTILIWVYILRKINLPLRQQPVSELWRYTREFPDFGRFVSWSSLGSTLRLVSQQVVVVVVGFFAGQAAAGFFRLGHQLGQVLARIADGVSFAFFMEYARMSAGSSKQSAQSLVTRTIRATGLSSVIILALLFTGGKAALVAVFGDAYLPAFPFVLLLGAAAAVQVGVMALEPVLMARGLAGRVMLANLFGALLMMLLLALFLEPYGALGAAMAVLGSALGGALAMMLAYVFNQKAQPYTR